MELTYQRTTFCLLLVCLGSGTVFSATYNDTKRLLDDILSSSVYDSRVRPVINQEDTVYVSANFQVVSIVEVDDVRQAFICNGFLVLDWVDQRLTWDPKKYNDVEMIRPRSTDIWKPRTILMNTLAERDLFEDDHAPLSVHSNGHTSWAPGGLFPVSCELDMSNYPFDEQACVLELSAMGLTDQELKYVAEGEPAETTFFTPNGEWEIQSSNVTNDTIHVDSEFNMPSIMVYFTLKRRPTFLILNVVMPVVVLSFLNVLVFLIPVDSGEKISFGVTLLLAVSVFLSMVSSNLPRASTIVPNLTIYLACLLILSVLTVVVTVIIVQLHHLEESEDVSIKARENFQQAFDKVKRHRSSAVGAMPHMADVANRVITGNSARQLSGDGANMRGQSSLSLSSAESLPPYEEKENIWEKRNEEEKNKTATGRNSQKNRYRVICQYIDMVSFAVFFLLWLGLTLAFLVKMSV